MKTYTHSGIVVDASDGSGRKDLRVEAWDEAGVCPDMVEHAMTDGDGRFELRLREDDVAALFGDRQAEVYFKVIYPVMVEESYEVLAVTQGSQTWLITAEGSSQTRIRTAGTVDKLDTLEPLRVRGQYVDADDGPYDSGQIRVFDEGIGKRSLLGSVEFGAGMRGLFQVTYDALSTPLEGKAYANLRVRAYDNATEPDENFVAETELRCLAAATVVMDVVVGGEAYRGKPEHETLEAAVAPLIDPTSVGLATLTDEQLQQLACSCNRTVAEVRALSKATAVAEELGSEASVPVENLHGLIRQGLSEERTELLSVPRRQLRAALERAMDARQIAERDATALDVDLDALRDAAIQMAKDSPTTTCNLDGLLAVALSSGTDRDLFLGRYAGHEGSSPAEDDIGHFWQALVDDEVFGPDTATIAARIQVTLQWGVLSRYHLPLVDALEAKRVAGTWTRLEDVAELDEAGWYGLLVADSIDPPAELPGTTLDDRRHSYAAMLERTMEAAMPTRAIAGRIKASPPTADLATFFTNFLDRTTGDDFDFGAKRVESYWEAEVVPDGLGGFGDADALKADLKAMERLYKLTPRHAEMTPLKSAGLDSARAITRYGQSRFVSEFADQFDVGAEDGAKAAKRIYLQASRQSAAAVQLYSMLNPALNGPKLTFTPDYGSLDPEIDPLLVDWPVLFGTLESCACTHCESVYSPSAYLVDLLHWLGRFESSAKRDPVHPEHGVWSAKELLLGGSYDTGTGTVELPGRRPDLARIELSCANTETPLPYIDLVNELLERMVGGGALPDSIGTGATAEELLATPEVLDLTAFEAAYAALADAYYPFSLPYSLRHHQARTFLGYLGAPRHELMELMQATAGPAGITGCRLWLRADLGLSGAGGKVERWEDLSGSGNHAVQPEADVGPATGSGGGGGQPFVEFSGAERLYIPDSDSLDIAHTDTATVVVITSDVASGTVNVVSKGALTVAWNYGIRRSSAGKAGMVYHDADVDGPDWTTGGTSAVVNLSEIAEDHAKWRLDAGESVVSGSHTMRVNTQPLHIGARPIGAWPDTTFDRHLTGRIYEIIIYDHALTVAETEALEAYAFARYQQAEAVLEPTDLQIAQERLGLSPVERQIVVDPDSGPAPGEYWGFDGSDWESSLLEVEIFLEASGLDYDELQELCDSGFMAGFTVDGQPTIAPAESYLGCDPEHLVLSGLDEGSLASTWQAVHRFLRLRQRLGWSIRSLDKLHTALADDSLDDAFLQALGDVLALRHRLGPLPLAEMAAWWADLDIQPTPSLEEPSQYGQLFLNKAVTNPVPEAFENVLDDPPSPPDLRDHLDHVLGALRMSAADFALLTDGVVSGQQLALEPAVSSLDLDLTNLSRLYRLQSLARTLDLDVSDLLALQALTGLAPLAGDDSANDVSPAETRAFVTALDRLHATDLSLSEAHYLVRHVSEPTDGVTAEEEAAQSYVDRLETGLDKIVSDTEYAEDPSGESLRRLLSELLTAQGAQQDPALSTGDIAAAVDKLMAIVEGSSLLTDSEQQEALDDVLGPLVADIDAVKAVLLARPYALSGCELWIEPRTIVEADGRVTGFGNLVLGSSATVGQLTGDLQPEYVEAGAYGLRAAAFDGTDDQLDVSGLSYATGSHSVFGIVRQHARTSPTATGTDGGATILDAYDSGSGKRLVCAADTPSDPADGQIGFYGHDGASGGWVDHAPNAAGDQRLGWVFDHGASTCDVYRDGAQLGSSASYTHHAGIEGVVGIGGHPSGLADPFRGHIACLAVFSKALDTSELEQVHDYLALLAGEPAVERFAVVQRQLLDHLRRRDAEAFVKQLLASAFDLSAKSTASLLTEWLTAPHDPAQALLSCLLPPTNAGQPAVSAEQRFDAMVRLGKAARVTTAVGLTDSELAWVQGPLRDPAWLDLNDLPLSEPAIPGGDLTEARARYEALLRLGDLVQLRKSLRAGPDALVELFEAAGAEDAAIADLWDLVSDKTGWSRDDLETLSGRFGLSSPVHFRDEWGLIRLSEAFGALGRLGTPAEQEGSVGAAGVLTWLDVDDADSNLAAAEGALRAAKAKNDDARWPTIARPLRDELRSAQRDALVAHMVHTSTVPEFADADGLFEHLLCDAEMSPCALTSRVKLALSSVQSFVQRILLDLEPEVSFDRDARDQWEWRKSYRVWEANRKVFFYPENWLEPELRMDRTPFFDDLVSQLRQNEPTEEVIEAAYRDYLRELDEVGQLDVCGMVHHKEEATEQYPSVDQLHVFGRTPGHSQCTYYHRMWVDRSYWTPWTKVPVDGTVKQLLPVVQHGRVQLHLLSHAEQFEQLGDDPAARRWWTRCELQTSHLDMGRWSAPMAASPVQLNGMRDAEMSRTGLVHETNDQAGTAAVTLVFDSPKQYAWGNSADSPDASPYLPLVIARYGLDPCRGILSTGYELANGEPTALAYRRPVGSTLSLSSYSLPCKQLVSIEQRYLALHTWHTQAEYLGSVPIPCRVQNERVRYFQTQTERLVPIDTLVLRGADRTLFAAFEPFPSETPPTLQVVPSTLWAQPSQVLCYDFPDIPASVAGSVADLLAVEVPHSIHAVHLKTSPQLRLSSFYHPYVCRMREALYRFGVDGLRSYELLDTPELLDSPLQELSKDYFDDYSPNPLRVAEPYPRDEFDFAYGGAYAPYNWELFFHVPLLIAAWLKRSGDHEEARRWLHAIFDPRDADEADPKAVWKFKPLRDLLSVPALQTDILLTEPESDLAKWLRQSLGGAVTGPVNESIEAQIDAWEDDPFNPHRIARMRPTAYQKAVVRLYIDNLLEWGDKLFRRDTIESINEALQLYLLAAKLLGPRPERYERPEPAEPPDPDIKTFAELEQGLGALSNSMVELESVVPLVQELIHPPAGDPPEPEVAFFCVPENGTLLTLWDTVGDRLFKIRHCMNIEGIVRELPLFQPPIDPALLIRAKTAGLDIDSVLSDLYAPPPLHRFTLLHQRATELCSYAISLGQSLLSALEKQDAEVLAQLRAGHEVAVLELVRETRVEQVSEAEETAEATRRSLALADKRFAHYSGLIERGVSALEQQALDKAQEASDLQEDGQELQQMAQALYLIPDLSIGASGLGVANWVTLGGSTIGKITEVVAQSDLMDAAKKRDEAAMTATVAGYERRGEDWGLQRDLAELEQQLIDKQIAAADIRIEIAKHELSSHERQLDNAKSIRDALQDKFTNDELYLWMAGELSSTYQQAYNLAFDMARRAERAFQFERVTPDRNFIEFGYWDGAREGLVAGEKLMLDLRRMEAAYLETDRREYELTKSISLAEWAPEALIELRETGSTQIALSEMLFDLDYPGHYFRRLRSVSLTLPAVTGPYTNVNCTLTLLSNKLRTSSVLANDAYVEDPPGEDGRFLYSFGQVKSVCTSSGQNDAGLFELSFRGDRLLPFEGAGAASAWRIDLPQATNRFDLSTLTDVVLQLQYTAREGGGVLGAAAMDHAKTGLLPRARRLLSARHEFDAAWEKFETELDGSNNQVLELTLADKLPFVPGTGLVKLTALGLALHLEHAEAGGVSLPVTVEPVDAPDDGDVSLTDGAVGLAVITYGGQEVDDVTWSVSVSQDAILALPEDFREDHPYVAGQQRLKPEVVRDLLLVCDIERDPLP